MGHDDTCLQCHQEIVHRQTKLDLEAASAALSTSEELEAARLNSVLLTTEHALDDLQIVHRHGLVSAEVVFGLHFFKDVAAAMRDTFGGRSKVLEGAIRTAREAVIKEVRREAIAVGANAVVAVCFTYNEVAGGGKSMLLVVASGTAVTVQAK